SAGSEGSAGFAAACACACAGFGASLLGPPNSDGISFFSGSAPVGSGEAFSPPGGPPNMLPPGVAAPKSGAGAGFAGAAVGAGVGARAAAGGGGDAGAETAADGAGV